MSDDERAVMAALARRFYLDDLSKTELAAEFAMSRFRVARMLQQAREVGLVTITINDGADGLDVLSWQGGSKPCSTSASSSPRDPPRRTTVGAWPRLPPPPMKQHIRAGDLVGLSWGRTLVSIGEELADLPPVHAHPAHRDRRQRLLQVPRRGDPPDRRPVQRRTLSLFCPLFAGTAEAASVFRHDPAVRRVMDSYRDLRLAVLSLGSWDPPITQLRSTFEPRDADGAGRRRCPGGDGGDLRQGRRRRGRHGRGRTATVRVRRRPPPDTPGADGSRVGREGAGDRSDRPLGARDVAGHGRPHGGRAAADTTGRAARTATTGDHCTIVTTSA